MPNPNICPVCELDSIEHILEGVQIVAKVNGAGENVAHGIVVYRCTQKGHIFFLRISDVNADCPSIQ
jgi:hypothetical protein